MTHRLYILGYHIWMCAYREPLFENALDRTSAVIVSKNLEQAVREDQENGGNT